MKIRELTKEEISQALTLTWSVFQKYESPDYSEEGIHTFHHCIKDPNFIEMLKFYGAFENENMVGTLATRSEGTHIALFFVDGVYHKKGIGRMLFEKACADNTSKKITVNSSPYAVEVYHHLGFIDTDVEQLRDGIRYTPMACDLE